jgi:hypothetical protein
LAETCSHRDSALTESALWRAGLLAIFRVRLRFVVTVTQLKPSEVATVDRQLPLSRLLPGYVDAGADPVQVSGPIMLRGRPFDVDDTLVYLTKHL